MKQTQARYNQEQRRLQELHALQILDTPRHDAFDRISHITHYLLDTPLAQISLIDKERLWVKSVFHDPDSPGAVMTTVSEMPRRDTFCQYTIESDEPLVITDAAQDKRSRNLPVVKGAPHIRFYAGAPLITAKGNRLGTVCVLDTKPRPQPSPEDLLCLQEMAALAFDEIMLLKRARESETSNEARTRFLAYICHEMRTPLGVLLGSVEVFHKYGELSAKQQEILKTMKVASDSVYSLINDFLDFTKVQNDNFKIEEAALDYGQVFDKVATLLRNKAERKGLEFRLDIEPVRGLIAIGDENRFRQIIVNLATNAIKFTDKGHILISATIARNPRGEPVMTCRVSDTGIGISEAQMDKLFKSYVQLEPNAPPYEDTAPDATFGHGSGLGLAISNKLAAAMGGQLSCHSAPGRGSSFVLTMPHRPYEQGHGHSSYKDMPL